jgi:hypothetical protein
MDEIATPMPKYGTLKTSYRKHAMKYEDELGSQSSFHAQQ